MLADNHCHDHRTLSAVFLENFEGQYYIHSAERVLLLVQEELAAAEHFAVDCKGTVSGEILLEMPHYHCSSHSVFAKLRVHRTG